MRYVLLLYGKESVTDTLAPEELQARIDEHRMLDEELERREIFRGGAALLPTTAATTVRAPHGDILKTDGPFAETKEQLGGFYILDCDNLDEAMEIAARMPAAKYGGSVEIRPVMTGDNL